MRNTDTLLPANVTWKKLREWNSGKPFFSAQYQKKENEFIRQSKYKNTSLGNLFVAMLDFYTRICPFGTGRIILDKGTFPPLLEHETDCLVFDSILLRRTSDKFALIDFYLKVFK
eukprot:NP_001040732.1 Uncharacterized protein CELE_C07D10.6 [Caenorhabditis elegans]